MTTDLLLRFEDVAQDYARIFEEAALRLLKDPTHQSRKVRIGYRKPFFAGDTATIRVRTFKTRDAHVGACGTFESSAKAHVHVSMLF